MSQSETETASLATPLDIGTQIRELRRSRGMNLVELSDKVGRSVGNLSEMERGKSPVTITLLQDLARALDVPFNWFFSGNAVAPPEERGVIVRRDNRRMLNLSTAGVTEELLSPDLGAQLEVLRTVFAPGATTGDRQRLRRGEEAGVVIRGQFELTTEGRSYLLEAGDSFSLRGEGAHWCRNPGTEDCEIIWVITPPCF